MERSRRQERKDSLTTSKPLSNSPPIRATSSLPAGIARKPIYMKDAISGIMYWGQPISSANRYRTLSATQANETALNILNICQYFLPAACCARESLSWVIINVPSFKKVFRINIKVEFHIASYNEERSARKSVIFDLCDGSWEDKSWLITANRLIRRGRRQFAISEYKMQEIFWQTIRNFY